MQTLPTEFLLTLTGRAEAESLIVRAGLAATAENLPPEIDLPTFWRLCAENIRLKDDESHGVSADRVPRGSLLPLFIAAKEAETLGEALKRLAATAPLIRKECRIQLGRSRDATHLTLCATARNDARGEVYVECFAMVVHCALRWMTGLRLRPLRVRGAASIAHMGGGLLAVLDAPLTRQGRGVTLVYPRRDMDAPILARKYKVWGEEEFESFLALLHEHDVEAPEEIAPTRASEAVTALLQKGLYSQDAVSDALHWSVATLRRRLMAEGTSFRRLSAEVRGAQLQHLLATDVPLEAISEKLGLSDVRSLRRVCRKALGASAREYRRDGFAAIRRDSG